MKLVSFYADIDGTTTYSDAAKNLMKQCAALGVDHLIVERDFGNTWIDNVRAKPLFLLEMFDTLGEPFLWLDCDSRILKPLDFTVASEWGIYLRKNGTAHDFVHYVSQSPRARNFIELWIRTIEMQQKGSHWAFRSILSEIDHEVLPAGYFEIVYTDTASRTKYLDAHL